MKTIEEKEETKWEVEDAVNALMRYQKIISDEKKKELVKKELKRRKEEITKAIEEI